MRRLPVHTNSSMACYRRCPREYYYCYVMLRRPVAKAHSLRFGSLFHLGLNAWHWTNGDSFDRMVNATNAMRVASMGSGIDPFDLVKAEEMMLGYTAQWGQVDWVTIGVEMQFKFSSWTNEENDYIMTGSSDVVIRDRTAKRIVEHKTSSQDIQPGSPYWSRVIALDPQVSTYLHGIRSMGHDVQDCVYDVVHKVLLEPHKATPEDQRTYTKATKKEPSRLYASQRSEDESLEDFRQRVRADIVSRPQFYFVRQTVVRLDHDHAEHSRDLNATAIMIAFAMEKDIFPRSPNACERFGRLCSYHPVCSGNESIDSAMFRTAKTAHEELA